MLNGMRHVVKLHAIHLACLLVCTKDMVDNGLALLSKRPMTPAGELPVTSAQHAPAAQHATRPESGKMRAQSAMDVLACMQFGVVSFSSKSSSMF